MRPAAAAFAVLVLLASPMSAGFPASDEVQVNTYTTDTQDSPRAVIAPDGRVYMVWESYGQNTPTTFEEQIVVRVQGADGTFVSGELEATGVGRYANSPDVAGNASGFVVVWESRYTLPGRGGGVDTDSDRIVMRRFDSTGAAVDPGELQVNSYTSGRQEYPAVAMAPDGSFVVVWQSYESGSEQIKVRRFDSAGAALGEELQVNANTSGTKRGPAIDMTPGGDFLVVWEESDFSEIKGRLFAAGRGGAEQLIASPGTFVDRADVAFEASGRALVTWDQRSGGVTPGDDTSGSSVQGRFLDVDGVPTGAQFQVNGYTTGYQDSARVAGFDGEFLVVWEAPGPDPGGGIAMRRIDLDGPAGGELQVNAVVTGNQFLPSVAGDGDEEFVVLWSSNETGFPVSSDVKVRRFALPFFADGFESGDTSSWGS